MNQTIETLEIIIKAKVDDALKGIKQVGETLKNTSSQTEQASNKMASAMPSIGNKIKQAYDGAIAKIRMYKSSTTETNKQQELLKMKIDDIQRVLASNEKNSFLDSSDVVKQEAELEKLQKQLRKLQQEEDKTEKKSKKTFGSMSNITKGLENSLNKGLKSIKRFTLSLFSIQSVMSAVSRASQSYLSIDEELNDQIDNSWKLLGSLLAPVLELVTNLFAQATSYVYEFVKALTGIDFKARANAKALKNQAKASKEASKQLSGIDDINNLSSNKGGGTSTPAISSQDVDMGIVDKVTEKLAKVIEMFKKGDFASIGKSISKSLEKINFSKLTKKLVKAFGTAVNSFVSLMTNIKFGKIGANLVNGLVDGLGTLSEVITSIDWKGIGKSVSDNVLNLLTMIDWKTMALNISLNLISILKGAINMISSINWAKIGEEIVNAIFDFIEGVDWLELAKYILLGIANGIVALVDLVVNAFRTLVKRILDFLGIHSPSTLFAEVGVNIMKGLIKGVEATLGLVVKAFQNVWQKIKDVFSGVANFFSSTFKAGWGAVINAFEVGGRVFKTIVESIKDIFKSLVNGIIGGINKVLGVPFKGINAALATIRDVNLPVIGKPFKGLIHTVDVPVIPKLAKGNVATSPTLALFGEYANAKSNPEITTPQKTMENSFRKVLGEQTNTQNNRFVINLGSKNIFDEFIDYVNEKTQRNGVSVFKEV